LANPDHRLLLCASAGMLTAAPALFYLLG
jgi:hypothetical protein